jgi:peptidoglycan-N-acetylglucosamine deacetylase
MERVRAYAAAGHKIGLYVPVSPSAGADFIAEFKKGHEIVSKLPNFFPSVRYPVPKDPKQDAIPAEVQSALAGAGYTIGYYTASAADARMNQLVQRAIEEKKPINWDYVRDVYLRLHVESFQFYDQMAGVVSNNRAGSHILLLHENDMSARFMLPLIVQCRRMGSETITVTEAMKDPVAQMTPKLSPQARLVGLALERQGTRALFPERATDEGMDKMFEFFNAFNGKK